MADVPTVGSVSFSQLRGSTNNTGQGVSLGNLNLHNLNTPQRLGQIASSQTLGTSKRTPPLFSQPSQQGIVGLYSMKLANPYYTGPVLKAQRSIDNSTLDFWADADGALMSATGNVYSAWVGSGTANLLTWYDQSQNDMEVLKYPPISLGGGTSNPTTATLTSSPYGNGSYTYSASTQLNTSEFVGALFNGSGVYQQYSASTASYSTSTGLYVPGTSTTTVSGSVYNGEWVQLQLPYAIYLTGYYRLSNSGGTRNETSHVLAGSNNGTTWILLNSTSDPAFTTSTTLNLNVTTAYSYYRLIALSVNTNGGTNGYWSLAQLDVYGRQALTSSRNAVSTTASGGNPPLIVTDPLTSLTPYLVGTATANHSAPFIGSTGGLPTLYVFPPAAMTSNGPQNITGYPAGGSGNYTVSESSVAYSAPGWIAFNSTIDGSDFWHTLDGVYNGSGDATSGTTTGFANGSWLQIKFPSAVTLYNYSIVTRSGFNARTPYNFYVVGSNNDGVSWTLVDTQTAISGWSPPTAKTFTIASPILTAFTIFRLVTTKINGVDGSLQISNWSLNGSLTAPAPPQAPSSNVALILPGTSGAYMNLGTTHPANFDLATSNLFVECWVYFNSLSTQYQCIVADGPTGSGASQECWFISINPSNAVDFKINAPAVKIATSSTILTAGVWYHVAASYNSVSSTGYIFVNGGTPNSVDTVTPKTSTGASITLGAYPSPSSTVYMNGYIRDLRVVQGGIVPTSSFTPDQVPFGRISPSYTPQMGNVVFALYAQYFANGKYVVYFPNGVAVNSAYYGLTFSPQTISGAMMQYRTISNPSTYQTLLSSSTTGYTQIISNQIQVGTVASGPLISLEGSTGTLSPTPTFNNTTYVSPSYYQFTSASSTYMNFGSQTLNLGTLGFSAVCWIQWDGYNNWQRVFDFSNGDNGNQDMFLTIPGTGSSPLRFMYKEAGSEQITDYSSTISLNTLYKIGVVYNPNVGGTNGRVQIWINGAVVVTNTSMAQKGTDKTYIRTYYGKSSYADAYFGGRYYKLNIYNRALPDSEVIAYTTTGTYVSGYGLYDGTYFTSPTTNTDGPWHALSIVSINRDFLNYTHIGHPDVSVSLGNRSFYGYMSEVIMSTYSQPTQTVAGATTVPDYNIFYKNAHVPSWQNGLIASYTPENWTGSSWLNGNFGTLPVTTLTGTTTKVASTNYQNIFTTLSSGAQTSARAIFSFRRVNTLYLGPNFRIRRSSDNFVQAFYADGAGNLGTAIGATGQPLLDWLGGSVAYVETWYDQSLNVRHATQTTWTLQPALSLANKCVDFRANSGGAYMNLPSGTVPMQTTYTFVARHGYIGNATGGFVGAGNNANSQGNNLRVDSSQGYWNYWYNNDAPGANLGGPPVKESVVTCRYDGPTTAGTIYFFVNGVQTNSGARTGWAGVAGNEVIGKTTADVTLNGLLYDCFVFASALSDVDRTSIENVLMNSSSDLPTLYGPSTATMTWPTGVLPSTYSMFHLAKYQKPNRGNNRRILQGTTSNWLSGFWNGYSGVAYHNGWLTQYTASAHGTNWVLSTDQNSLYRSLGRTRGTTGAGTPSSDTLAINAGYGAESTDFTFQALMVYNRTLNATEYQMVEDYLANRFKLPVPPQEGLALSLDASDYFTTDGTTWPDRSPNGSNFTLSAIGAYVSTGAFPYMALSTNRATIATAVPAATYNTLIVFGTILNSTGNWRSLMLCNGGSGIIIIETGTNRLGFYNGGFIPCDQNVDVTTLDQVYTRFNMHVWKLSSVSPYYQYYFNPNVAPCRPTGVITNSRVAYTSGFTSLGDNGTSAQYWGNTGTVLYYNRDLSDQELVETYQRHMTKYLLPTPFVPMSPVPNGYVFTRSGMYTPGTGVTALKVLVIAGGGGGGGGFEGGGGGAGGLLFSGFYYVTAGVPIQVIIGQGGRGARRNSLPENGGNTIFGTMTAIGGGAGSSEQNTTSIGPAVVAARSGGSGGGGSWGAPSNNIFPPGAGTTGQGTSGGAGFGAPYVGGGGGGAATPGLDASYAYAGNGGDGRSWTLMGITKTYCGGGGGSLRGSGTSSGGLGGGGGGNGAGTGANATYYGSGGGAGGGNGVACMGGDGFQGIVIVEVNVDPYPVPVLQNPGNKNFVSGGQFNINQTVDGIADITWTITQVYNAANLASPGNQTFTNGGFFTVTNSTNPYLTGALVWTISPTIGMTLVSSTTTSATFQCSAFPGISSVPYVVTATGPTGVAGSSPSFIVTNTSTYLYNFSTFTFTPMGATGRTGPTAITYGSSTPGFGTGSVMTLGTGTSTGMQLWVVPVTANYSVTVAGARGGNGTQAGGNGAIVTVTLALTSGHVLRLLPGQIGTAGVSGCNITKAGGGGGSFVYNNNTSTILIVAGGGGGGSGGVLVTPDVRNASLTTSGNKGDGTTGGAGGTAGNGGTGGSTACTSGAGGGGGWSGNGTNGVGAGNFGTSFINGATGGLNDNEGTTNGGFGGAGAAGAHPGGGGGGYSGGGGGGLQTCSCGDTQVGGGGGSYATVSFTSSSVTNTGAGYITISKL